MVITTILLLHHLWLSSTWVSSDPYARTISRRLPVPLHSRLWYHYICTAW